MKLFKIIALALAMGISTLAMTAQSFAPDGQVILIGGMTDEDPRDNSGN